MQTSNENLQDFDDEEESSSSLFTWLKRFAIILLALAVLAGLGYGIKNLMSGSDAKPKKTITKIALKDVPPPPPPPPPKEPPKEQPKDQPKEVKEVQQPKPAEAPPSEQLKMDGPAGDGPSAFAAGEVKNEYKGGDVKTIGSDGGAKYNWYAGLVKSQIEAALEKNNKLAEGQYEVIVTVWLRQSGEIEKLEVGQSDAEPQIELAIKTALDAMPAMREVPPEGMPQPIKLRITARKMG